MQRTVGGISYTFQHKKVKNYNLRITRTGEIRVSAPNKTPLRQIDDFVLRHSAFIVSSQKKVQSLPGWINPKPEYQPGDQFWLFGNAYTVAAVHGITAPLLREKYIFFPEYCFPVQRKSQLVRTFLQQQLSVQIAAFLKEYLPKIQMLYQKKPTKICYKDLKARYGSCQPQAGILTFSLLLAHLPPAAVAYVVVHELAHLQVPNHSAAFYQTVAALMPDYLAALHLLKGKSKDLC